MCQGYDCQKLIETAGGKAPGLGEPDLSKMETIIVGIIIGVAVVYMVLRVTRSVKTGNCGGCSAGCNCKAKPGDAACNER